MPLVQTIEEIPEVPLTKVWDTVCDFERYAESMDNVLEVRYLERGLTEATSSWRILLNGSEMTWDERDVFEPQRRISFDQIEGDLEVFRGEWLFEEMDGLVVVKLNVEFDLGIPSLSQLLDPIGIQAIRSNSRQMLKKIRILQGDQRRFVKEILMLWRSRRRVIISGMNGVVGFGLTEQLLPLVGDDVELRGIFSSEASMQAFYDDITEFVPDVFQRITPLICDLSNVESVQAATATLPRVDLQVGIHAAADVSWHKSEQELSRINVQGSRNFARLVRDSAVETRLIHVSSSFARTHDRQPCNAYELTKAVSERVVLEEFRQLAPSVFRCSLVVGNSGTGRIRAFHGIYPIISLLDTYCPPFLVGSRNVRIDIVPVDWVARELSSLVLSALAGQRTPDVTACSGDGRRTLPELLELVRLPLNECRKTINAPPLEPIPVLTFRQVDFLRRSFDAWDVRAADPTLLRKLDRLMAVYRPYLEEDRTRPPTGITTSAPPPESYLERVVKYWWKTAGVKRHLAGQAMEEGGT